MAHSRHWKIALLSGAVTVSGAAACGDDDNEQDGAGGLAGTSMTLAGQAGESSEGGAAGLTALTDAQILLTLDTLNAGEVDEARAVMPRLSNPDVVAFAKRMVTDHTNARELVKSTANQLQLSPASNAVEQTLRDESQQHIAHFEMTSGELDVDYLGVEVTGHAQALGLLTTLQQAADAAALRNLIATMETTVQSHYQAAEQLQTSL